MLMKKRVQRDVLRRNCLLKKITEHIWRTKGTFLIKKHTWTQSNDPPMVSVLFCTKFLLKAAIF